MVVPDPSKVTTAGETLHSVETNILLFRKSQSDRWPFSETVAKWYPFSLKLKELIAELNSCGSELVTDCVLRSQIWTLPSAPLPAAKSPSGWNFTLLHTAGISRHTFTTRPDSSSTRCHSPSDAVPRKYSPLACSDMSRTGALLLLITCEHLKSTSPFSTSGAFHTRIVLSSDPEITILEYGWAATEFTALRWLVMRPRVLPLPRSK
ncbi:RNA polymerase sigma factor, putative [Babesia ovis]|uniref:RNA polymerase sigma factor, putative n=1 Tax=Babesia ovis TaxID=5869 RepID=A0A9W5TBX4_BABOV|nr:RNA polymerase sigma factor, putative [Babesia ovis]